MKLLRFVSVALIAIFKLNAQLIEPKKTEEPTIKTFVKRMMKYNPTTQKEELVEVIIDKLDVEKEQDLLSGELFKSLIDEKADDNFPLLVADVKTEVENQTRHHFFSAYPLLVYLYKPILTKIGQEEQKFDIFDVIYSQKKRGNFPLDQFALNPVNKTVIISPIDIYLITKTNPVAEYVTNDMQLASTNKELQTQAVLTLSANATDSDISPGTPEEQLKKKKSQQQQAQIFLADRLAKHGKYQDALKYYIHAYNTDEQYAKGNLTAQAAFQIGVFYYKGLGITKPAYNSASRYFNEVAKLAYARLSIPAKIYLAEMYASGKLTKDINQAKTLLETAKKEFNQLTDPQSKQNLLESMKNLEILEKQIMQETSSGKNVE
jgi:hypothetical protein